MKTKQQIVAEFRHTEIIDAARTIFARRGFTLATMDEIAKEAGIAKGTIYLYFRSKTEVYKAVLDHDMESLKMSTLERIDAASTLREKIAAFSLARIENAEARKELFVIMDSESANLALTRSQYRDWLREPVSHLAKEIEQASQRGEIRPTSAEKVAWIVADMTRGAIQRRLLNHSDYPVGEDAEFITAFVWAALTQA
jgi:TetR/AcrR family transcriptional regulator of autoinduction and epiphytic fitness